MQQSFRNVQKQLKTTQQLQDALIFSRDADGAVDHTNVSIHSRNDNPFSPPPLSPSISLCICIGTPTSRQQTDHRTDISQTDVQGPDNPCKPPMQAIGAFDWDERAKCVIRRFVSVVALTWGLCDPVVVE